MSARGKIALFSYFFPPSGGISCQRALRFAKYLPRFGWEVVVVSSANRRPWRITDESLLEKTRGMTVLRFPSPGADQFYSKGVAGLPVKIALALGAVGNLDPMYPWRRNVAAQLGEILRAHKPDVVIVTVPPFSAMGLVEDVKRLSPQTPVVVDMRDLLWLYHPYGSFARRVANRLQRLRAQELVTRWLAFADGVTVPAEAFRTTVSSYTNAPVCVVPTPFDPDDYENLPDYERGERFVMLHSGSLHRYNDPEPLLGIISLLPDDVLEGILLVLQGHLSRRAERLLGRYSWVKILPHASHSEALANQRKADANLVFVTLPERFGGHQILPGKVFDYIGAQRPILALAPKNSELGRLVLAHRLGFFAPIDEPPLAAGIITKMFRLWQSGNLAVDGDADAFNAKSVVPRLAKFIEEVSKTR